MSADQELLEREPTLPGVAVLFDEAALTACVQAHQPSVSEVRLRYLRYKPGTAMVAGLTLTAAEGTSFAAARAMSMSDQTKLVKYQDAAQRAGAWSVTEPEHGLCVYDAAADRHLPGLRRVLRSGSEPETGLHALRYKPERRWVGRREAASDGLGPALIKVHRPHAAQAAVTAHRTVAQAGLPVPTLRKTRIRRGLVISDWLPGTPLDATTPTAEQLTELGAVLARLHALPCAGAPGEAATEHRLTAQVHRRRAEDITTAVRAISAVHPEAAELAARTARRVLASLSDRAFRNGVLHGDLSADQVLVRPNGDLTLLDLDRSRVGDPIEDLASWIATDLRQGMRRGRAQPLPTALDEYAPFVEAYQRAAGPVAPVHLHDAVAVALLMLADEPFRYRSPDWANEIERIVQAAAWFSGVTRFRAAS
ncbi:MAG TPA: phosphotransferase [Jiangellaceae bacterium]|nr:phosphotransferase [Jiangellaceae bacterium]